MAANFGTYGMVLQSKRKNNQLNFFLRFQLSKFLIFLEICIKFFFVLPKTINY